MSPRTRGRGEEVSWKDSLTSPGESLLLLKGVRVSGMLGVFRLEELSFSFTGARGAIAMSAAAIVVKSSDERAHRNRKNAFVWYCKESYACMTCTCENRS